MIFETVMFSNGFLMTFALNSLNDAWCRFEWPLAVTCVLWTLDSNKHVQRTAMHRWAMNYELWAVYCERLICHLFGLKQIVFYHFGKIFKFPFWIRCKFSICLVCIFNFRCTQIKYFSPTGDQGVCAGVLVWMYCKNGI